MHRYLYISLGTIIFILVLYCYLFYPQQSMPVGEIVYVATPDSAKYHNDCLHPCIRYSEKTDKYYMAQSPYYGWSNKVENPMYYESDDYTHWYHGCLIADTPETGFNSDPNICIHLDGTISYIWRECYTSLCDSLGCANATVGGRINENGTLENKAVYCVNYSHTQDMEQAPVMIEHDGIRYIYATWYQYEPKRINRGIALWCQVAAARMGGAEI